MDETSSHATKTNTYEADEASTRPPGVKAAKAWGKKPRVDEKGLSDFWTLWNIKQQDLAMKERLSKMSLLDSLIAKQEPLSEFEEALKKKLITELLLGNQHRETEARPNKFHVLILVLLFEGKSRRITDLEKSLVCFRVSVVTRCLPCILVCQGKYWTQTH
ncbi:hypothetical protein DY000_02047544 [Brassica cretica]|uniref:Uncharacterized protein n=1 Tax=Brassica cretica TaxID=69181 RepID=A0ABQ7F787_BRACR|nr:hypothetical protein DY000_02047544 [Brassica cretica]